MLDRPRSSRSGVRGSLPARPYGLGQVSVIGVLDYVVGRRHALPSWPLLLFLLLAFGHWTDTGLQVLVEKPIIIVIIGGLG